MIATTQTVALGTSSRAEVLKAALVAALLGMTLIYATGFAGASVLHNAAHDSRHTMNFPCH